MSNKIWLKNYPAGMPFEIDPDLFSSIPDLFEKTAARFADRPAFHNLGRTISYGELERLSRAFAAFLQGLPGLTKGARVAIMAPNLLQYPVALLGILRAGMVVVNVNPLYTPREVEHQLKDAGVKAIVIVENFAAVLQQVLRNTPVEHVITSGIGDMLSAPKRWLVNFIIKRVKKMVPPWRIDGAIPFGEALARGAASAFKPVDVQTEDIAFLQYTGGTTKGAARVTAINQTTREAIADIIAKGVADGVSAGALGALIEQATAFDQYRAEMIARTELTAAYNAAALGSYAEVGIEMVEAIDGDEDELCADRLSRNPFTIDDADAEDEHPNGTLDWLPVIA